MTNQTSSPLVPQSSRLAELYPQFARRAERYACWMVGNRADAEEVVQEAFCRLAEKQQGGQGYPEDQLSNVLFTVVRHLCIDLQRKQNRRKQVSLAAAPEPKSDSGGDYELVQLQMVIDNLMTELPESWAEALKLKTTGELSYKEIASVMDCTLPQVRTWIFRAREQLAERLSDEGWMKR